ncbi:hypothetical protein HZB02_02390 [Candidatus Woesearchaeota archaeon]|nr:hypothetical protein [Candidatus Woesearchaeota archaeon]
MGEQDFLLLPVQIELYYQTQIYGAYFRPDEEQKKLLRDMTLNEAIAFSWHHASCARAIPELKVLVSYPIEARVFHHTYRKMFDGSGTCLVDELARRFVDPTHFLKIGTSDPYLLCEIRIYHENRRDVP